MLYTPRPDALFTPGAAAVVDPVGFGKVAVVTGCGSGIGLAVTQLLLAHQFSVCGLDEAAFDYSLLREADHGRFHFHRGDLTLQGACEEGVRICVATFGERIDVLVNVAGVMDNFSSADGVSDGVWDRVLAVNLTAPVKMMRSVLPYMRERRDGAIVNVASTAATSGAVAGVAYTASKHGLIGATKNVAWRFRHDGIRCNAVLPGAVDSSIGKLIASGRGDGSTSGDDDKAQLTASKMTPTTAAEEATANGWDPHGFAEVEPVFALQARPSEAAPTITALEVARAVVFLIGDHARTINGVSLPVDKAWGVV